MEGELAIRTELEMLRARSREQSSLIDRLNAEISVSRANSETGHASAAAASQVVPLNGAASAERALVPIRRRPRRLPRLRREIAVLQAQLEQAKGTSEAAAEAGKRAGNCRNARGAGIASP